MSHGLSDGKDPKVVCTQCGKSFRDSWQLGRHQMGGRCHEEVEDEPVPTEIIAETEESVFTEWTEEVEAPIPTRPFAPCTAETKLNPAKLQYFCKICGDLVTRIKFCTHMELHFTYVYLLRTDESPRQVTSTFMSQTEVDSEGYELSGGCRRCARNTQPVTNVKQTLQQLKEILPPPRMANT